MCKSQLHWKATSNEDQFDPKFPLIVHWDGRLLLDLTGTKKVDRLPVLVTSNGKSQLLAVQKLPSVTGEAQAQAVFNVLKKWGVNEKVQRMCFDTTSSFYTGCHKGACIILRQLHGCTLFVHWLLTSCARVCCRSSLFWSHGCIFCSRCVAVQPLQSPARMDWPYTSFEDSSTDMYISDTITDIKDGMVKKLESSVTVTQPRDDYSKLIELAIIFHDGVLQEESAFQLLGPFTKCAGNQR